MTATSPRPRRRILWILIAAVAIIALAIAAAVIAGTIRASESDPTIAPTDTSASPKPSASATADAEPTGCLGGDTRDADMLLAAQKAAPHTSNGAVEVAAAAMRWMYQYPVPSDDQIASASPKLFASSASAQFRDLSAAYAKTSNPSAGVVENGKTFYISTIPGVWHLESYTDTTATVSVGGGYVVDGELSPQLRFATTSTWKWEDGSWRLESGEFKRAVDDLYSIGTTFTGGC
ncbi:hypothetical protein [Schumannella soli]|uniref:Uncharacterized protein n=1 Tax=Schumannella soli TaxID=2590779 RepID=A0A506XYN4_9MICO|nr:hypothetical protein [Schumannella soli]TPW78044.1 hypothetical protein FJ657_05305 [Schumannella soli]